MNRDCLKRGILRGLSGRGAGISFLSPYLEDITMTELRKRMNDFCRERLSRFMIPQRVELVESSMHGERFKKMR